MLRPWRVLARPQASWPQRGQHPPSTRADALLVTTLRNWQSVRSTAMDAVGHILEDEEGDLRRVTGFMQDSGFPDDMLELWMDNEQEALRDASKGESWLLRPLDSTTRSIREISVLMVGAFMERFGLQTDVMAQTVAVLDVYWHRSVDATDVRSIPNMCFSICRTMLKVHMNWHQVTNLQPEDLQSMAEWFQQTASVISGQAVDVSMQDSGEQELRILKALDWRIDIPTAFTWLAAFHIRLAAVAPTDLVPTLGLGRERSEELGKMLTQQLSLFDIPPHRLARGLLGCGLMMAGLLPAEALHLQDLIGAEAWQRLLDLTPTPGGPAAAPQLPAMGREEEERLHGLVVLSMGCDRGEFHAAVLNVVHLLTDGGVATV